MLRLLLCCLNPIPTAAMMMPKPLCYHSRTLSFPSRTTPLRLRSRSITTASLTRDDIYAHPNPPKMMMDLGAAALKSALNTHLSATFPGLPPRPLNALVDLNTHLSATFPGLPPRPLNALVDLNLSEERLTAAAHRLNMNVHCLLIKIKIHGVAFEEPLPDYAIAFAGLEYVDSDCDVAKMWETLKVCFKPIIGPEDMEKLTPEELERQRQRSAEALNRRPIKYLCIHEILEDENPVHRFEELGAYALKVGMTKHLLSAYPDLSSGDLANLRDANLSRENLIVLANRLEAGKRRIWPKKRNMLPFKEPMSDSPMVMAGKIFVDVNYDLDKFWKRYKGHLDIITPEDLGKQPACGV